jgi:glycosyltransferase involved in cell wall biosynthesis
MELSFVIPTYNHPLGVHACIQSIVKQEGLDLAGTHEIIIALDLRDISFYPHQASCDMCQNFLAIRAGEAGANAARNAGIQQAKGERIYLLDDDCFLPDFLWLRRLHAYLAAHPEVMAFGSGYISSRSLTLIDQCQNALANEFLRVSVTDNKQTQALLGGSSCYKRSLFLCAECFDESIEYGSAETEYNDRLLSMGIELQYSADLAIMHYPMKKKRTSFLRKAFLQGCGTAYSFRKNAVTKKRIIQFSFMELLQSIKGSKRKKVCAFFVLTMMIGAYKLGWIYSKSIRIQNNG